MKKYELEKLNDIFAKNANINIFESLKVIQHNFGYISKEHIFYLSEVTSVPCSQIESILSFYKFFTRKKINYRIKICQTISCELKNKKAIISSFEKELGIKVGESSKDSEFSLEFCNCLGMCDEGPAILVNDTLISKLTSDKVPKIINACLNNRLEQEFSSNIISKVYFSEKLRDYNRGNSLENAKKISPEEIIQMLQKVNLRGRGGAGFPTWKKWQLAKEEIVSKKYVVCNADEGEPGTFKDRFLLHKHFGKVLEGILIGAYVLSAEKAFIYLRGEYIYLENILKEKINEYRSFGIVDEKFDIEICLGMGAYICGEETALIESLEGKRGEPRNRPPYPIDTGFFDCPTIVNNVETFYDISLIFGLGDEYFKHFGTENSTGLKLFSVSGDVKNEGIYVIPYGTTLKELVDLTDTKGLYAIVVGGAQGEFVKEKDFDKKLAFEALPSGGSIIFLDRSRDLLDVAKNFLSFFVEESCGQCTPCRLGVSELLLGIDKMKKGELSISNLNKLVSLANTIKFTSKCGLGSGSVNAFISLIDNFKEDVLGRIEV